MTARLAVELWGKKLIGQKVLTEQIGSYPGGVATIIELAPDPAAPEIVFEVEHPTFAEIGVFEWEDVLFQGMALPKRLMR